MQRAFINTKKNPQINRLRFFVDIPLWLFKFFFKSVNVPSILLFVFGIPAQFCFMIGKKIRQNFDIVF